MNVKMDEDEDEDEVPILRGPVEYVHDIGDEVLMRMRMRPGG